MNRLMIPFDGVLNAEIVLPGSKSMTNRALVLAALAEGETLLDGVLDSEDTQVLVGALWQLGLDIRHIPERRQLRVVGTRGIFPNQNAELYVGNSGTTARFLTALLSFSNGNYRIYGKPRMHERPIRDLVEALQSLGAELQYEANAGFPPLMVSGNMFRSVSQQPVALSATVAGSVSSQFLSALLMAAPLATRFGTVELRLKGNLVSKPYINMTIDMMQSFGVSPEITGEFEQFRFATQTVYKTPETYQIEPDASGASYFFAAAAVCGGSVTVTGLSRQSLQGDVMFVDCLEKMGCDVKWNDHSITVSRPVGKPLRGISVDMNSLSDTAQTLAAVALFAENPTEMTNMEHVRFKETDRITDLAAELRRFGAVVEEKQDGLRIIPPAKLLPATVETYDDHRMAMSFAVVGLKVPGVVICNPECTQKTFPDFFKLLDSMRNEA
ncbi:MAG: 3-phosphoshikimate 1-carboxyvinyltransferase [Planctomycetaceae bacterium]|jgi:3-phosphoshikimate 1-carboxyvinyltransferase|nr:3-phosphoshikimate 1-carboxyvinyltransferase [Planctomycetaceae bacterium]